MMTAIPKCAYLKLSEAECLYDSIFVSDLHNDKGVFNFGSSSSDHYKFQIDKETGQLTVYKWYEMHQSSPETLVPQIINDELVLN